MNLGDLLQKKNQKVKVRVPSHLHAKLGEKISGVVIAIRPRQRSVTMVRVKTDRGTFEFRPQDLSLSR